MSRIGIDAGSLDIRAIEVTKSSVGDGSVLPDLLDQIPEDQEIAFVTADGAYDTRACRDVIADRRANSVIPPRRNARPWKPDTLGARESSPGLGRLSQANHDFAGDGVHEFDHVVAL